MTACATHAAGDKKCLPSVEYGKRSFDMVVDDFDNSDLQRLLDMPLFHAVLESLSVGAALLDENGVYLYVNPAYVAFHGGTGKESYVGKHVCERFTTANKGSMKAIRTGKKVVSPSITVDGTKGVCSRIPILGKDKKIICVFTETLMTNISRGNLNELINTLVELSQKADYYKQQAHQAIGPLHTFETIASRSASMEQLKKTGKKYAQTENPILITGESGTGKELLAQALHMASPRSSAPFITVNCAALPPSLIESELFGYADGAFTGSRRSGMKGKFESADTGTIFLDEIGELSLDIQSKLLRVLESGEIQKIGQPSPSYSNFRLIAATNRNLYNMVEEGTFREDLYHRLSILELLVPPLRQRREDIPLLVNILMEQILGPVRAKEIRLTQACLNAFLSAPWKGNVREMKNILTSALCALDDEEKLLRVSHLSARFMATLQQPTSTASRTRTGTTLAEISSLAERELILATLEQCGGNCSMAARKLGISRTKLYKKFKQYDIH